jgi:hypothetical protein
MRGCSTQALGGCRDGKRRLGSELVILAEQEFEEETRC